MSSKRENRGFFCVLESNTITKTRDSCCAILEETLQSSQNGLCNPLSLKAL